LVRESFAEGEEAKTTSLGNINAGGTITIT